MKRAIYFIERDGIKYYKCDTFWSKSDKTTNAKIHDDSDHDKNRFFTSLCSGFKPWNTEELNDKDYNIIKNYEGGFYGYQTILDDITKETTFTLSESSNLSDPIYLRQIISISKNGTVDSIDYKVIDRDNKINSIIK